MKQSLALLGSNQARDNQVDVMPMAKASSEHSFRRRSPRQLIQKTIGYHRHSSKNPMLEASKTLLKHSCYESLHTTPIYCPLFVGNSNVGTVVHVYKGGKGYEVEFVDGGGHTVALITVGPNDIRPIKTGELLHARATA